jgi:hypothetical protein
MDNIQAGTATHPAGQAEGHVTLDTFKQDLNSCLEGMKFRTTYDKVFVQILTWEGSEAEIGLGLRHDVKVFKKKKPRRLSFTISCRLCTKRTVKTLAIFYYNGHSLYDPEKIRMHRRCWSK